MKKNIYLVLLLCLIPSLAQAEGYYFHYDHLGSVDVVTNEEGEVVAEYDYLPFGELYEERIYDEDFSNSYKFTDQEEDAETGLYYYGARYYGAEVGRFMAQDPAVYDERVFEMLEDPQSFNAYAYVRNNPVKFVDPSGEEPNKAQAGTMWNVIRMIQKFEKTNQSASIKDMLGTMNNYYDTHYSDSVRYVYTDNEGWIDMRHFFYFADKSYSYGSSISDILGLGSEFWQLADLGGKVRGNFSGNSSAFSYEDLPSDFSGSAFINYIEGIDNYDNYNLSELLEMYMVDMGATLPQNADNYDNLPKDSEEANKRGYNTSD